jgi:hypothetical protein
MRADADARAGTGGKRRATFWLKSAHFDTFYRFVQLKSTATEVV